MVAGRSTGSWMPSPSGSGSCSAESNTSHTLCTPFPTLLSSSVWTGTQTWYTCSVKWSLPPDIQNMLSIIGKAQDAKIAETMLQQKTVFWVPRDIWAEWSTSSSSNRFGWNVQVVGQRLDANGTTVLMVRSLHRDESSSRRHQRDISG